MSDQVETLGKAHAALATVAATNQLLKGSGGGIQNPSIPHPSTWPKVGGYPTHTTPSGSTFTLGKHNGEWDNVEGKQRLHVQHPGKRMVYLGAHSTLDSAHAAANGVNDVGNRHRAQSG